MRRLGQAFSALALVFVFLFPMEGHAQATGPMGFRLDFETGFQAPKSSASYFQATRLLLDRQDEILDGLTFNWGGEFLWLAGENAPKPPWPDSGKPNWIPVEWDHFNGNDGVDDASLRFSRLSLKENVDGFQAVAGLQAFDWGSGRFDRPTNYFNPLSPLAMMRQEPMGSEAVDLSQFLFDDLSVEAAGRLLAGGAAEWVLRLPDRGIGFWVVPSFAHLMDRQGVGLEGAATFPVFQARLEAVRWTENSDPAAFEVEMGLSTRWQDSDLCLEWLRDSTGEALGGFSTGNPTADYFYFSLRRALDQNWTLAPALVKSWNGGPFLFWPRVVLDFHRGWQFSLEGQVAFAFQEGPLAANPDRLFLALADTF
ncbi:MAG: hypothetical protein ACREL1_08970 [bacterium]